MIIGAQTLRLCFQPWALFQSATTPDWPSGFRPQCDYVVSGSSSLSLRQRLVLQGACAKTAAVHLGGVGIVGEWFKVPTRGGRAKCLGPLLPGTDSEWKYCASHAQHPQESSGPSPCARQGLPGSNLAVSVPSWYAFPVGPAVHWTSFPHNDLSWIHDKPCLRNNCLTFWLLAPNNSNLTSFPLTIHFAEWTHIWSSWPEPRRAYDSWLRRKSRCPWMTNRFLGWWTLERLLKFSADLLRLLRDGATKELGQVGSSSAVGCFTTFLFCWNILRKAWGHRLANHANVTVKNIRRQTGKCAYD